MLIEGVYSRLGSVRLCCGPLSKATRRETAVGRYVKAKAPRLQAALTVVLRRWGAKTAGAVAARYSPPGVEKDDRGGTDRTMTVRRILAALDAEAMAEDLADELETAMLAAFRRAAANGMMQVGFATDAGITQQMDVRAREWAQERGGELIRDLAGTTEREMQSMIGRAVEQGMSTNELRDSIEGMGTFGEARAETIARTELAYAHVQGNVAGWRESGMVVGKRAVLGDLHNIVDICDEAADAGVVGLEDEIVDGMKEPPWHPNCVCDVEPVLAGTETAAGK